VTTTEISAAVERAPAAHTRYTSDFGPNVQQILVQATRVVHGRIPAHVRAELRAAVKAGVLGRLPKNGLAPEIFFHPDHKHGAVARQKTEASYSIGQIAQVLASPADVRAGIEASGGDVLEYALAERGLRAEGRS
jgi:hypothetical protein